MNEFRIIEELNSAQVEQLSELLKQTWWAQSRTKEELSIFLENSLSFGLIGHESEALIGYARVLTDGIKYAYVFDVIVTESYRGKGLGKMLMESIIAHPKLKKIQNFELTCAPDMVRFYEQFNFSESYGNVVPMRFSRKIPL